MTVIFAFGPDNSFFFYSPKAWKWANVPDDLSNTLEQLSHPYCLALGPNKSFFVSWKDKNNKIWNYASHQGRLWNWVNKERHDSTTFRVTISATDSFWACSNRGYRWHDLPWGLEESIQSHLRPEGWTTKPVQVSLGYEYSYIVVYEPSRSTGRNHSSSESIKTLYAGLWSIIENEPIVYVALNAYKPGQYFVILKDGGIYWSVPEEWSKFIKPVLDQYVHVGSVSGSARVTAYRGQSRQTTIRLQDITAALDLGTAAINFGLAGAQIAAAGCVVM